MFWSKLSLETYFNSRLREGGDFILFPQWKFGYISIHASVKEATKDFSSLKGKIPISIHASVKEATMQDFFEVMMAANFNSRLREGGDMDAEECELHPKKFQFTPP